MSLQELSSVTTFPGLKCAYFTTKVCKIIYACNLQYSIVWLTLSFCDTVQSAILMHYVYTFKIPQDNQESALFQPGNFATGISYCIIKRIMILFRLSLYEIYYIITIEGGVAEDGLVKKRQLVVLLILTIVLQGIRSDRRTLSKCF